MGRTVLDPNSPPGTISMETTSSCDKSAVILMLLTSLSTRWLASRPKCSMYSAKRVSGPRSMSVPLSEANKRDDLLDG